MGCGIQRKCRKAAPRKSRYDTQSGNDTRPSATLQIQLRHSRIPNATLENSNRDTRG